MPINVFGKCNSNNSVNKIDASLFVQKPYLRMNYIESIIEENFDLKNQHRIKNLPDPISITEACSKKYVDNLFHDPTIIRNSAHIDLNDRNFTKARFIKVNQLPQIDSQLTAKFCVGNSISDAVDEPSLLRLDPDEKLTQASIILNSTLTSSKTLIELSAKNYVDSKFDDPILIKNTDHVDFNNKDIDNVNPIKVNSFPTLEGHLTPKIYVDQAISIIVDESLLRLYPEEKLNLDEQDSIFPNSYLTLPKTIIEKPTKNYVDSLHESSRSRRDLSLVFNDQDNEIDDNELTNLDSITINRNPNLDNELANKKDIDDELDKNTVLRLNQTLENYPEVSVGNGTYNLNKYDKIQITKTTIIKYPNTRGYLLQN